MKKTAIAISSDLSPPWPSLDDLDITESIILTRGNEPERSICAEALARGWRAFWYRAAGGADNWQRDVDLVRDADEVIVVLSPGAVEHTDTGTWHVAERAISDDKPLRVYLVHEGRLLELGSS